MECQGIARKLPELSVCPTLQVQFTYAHSLCIRPLPTRVPFLLCVNHRVEVGRVSVIITVISPLGISFAGGAPILFTHYNVLLPDRVSTGCLIC